MARWLAALAVLVGGCAPRGEGEPCDDDGDCIGQLVCASGRCAVDAKLHQRMARQSGVEVASESPAAESKRGAVKVRSASGNEYAYAVCNSDERLIGGWCEPSGSGGDSATFTESAARDYSATDTVGAKWTCQLRRHQVRAHALCQRLE